jgi:hypothetical protein
MWLDLCSSTHAAALTKGFNILANSFPPELVERFSKSASNSYVTNCLIVVKLKDQSQSELRVPRNTNAIETPKLPNYCFNMAALRPLTLVHIKRVLGVPLANEINELKAPLTSLFCASSNNGLDFRRNSESDKTSPSQNNGVVALGTKYGLRFNGSTSFMAPLRYASVIEPTNGFKSRR